MDVAAGVVASARSAWCPWSWCCWRVRSAEPPTSLRHGAGDDLERELLAIAGRDLRLARRRASSCSWRSRLVQPAAGRPHAALELAALAARLGEALFPGLRAAGAAAGRPSPGRGCRRGSRRPGIPAERLGAGRVPRRRAAPWALEVPAFLGAPKPMVVLQAISVGLSDFWRGDGASIASGSWPSMRERPAAGLEALRPGRPSRRARAGRRWRCRCRPRGRSAC
jgi:hypothetical protein